MRWPGSTPRSPSSMTQRTSLSALPGGFQSVGKRQPDPRAHIDASTLRLCLDFLLQIWLDFYRHACDHRCLPSTVLGCWHDVTTDLRGKQHISCLCFSDLRSAGLETARVIDLQADNATDVEADKPESLQPRNPKSRQTMAGGLRDGAVSRLLTCGEGSFRIGKSATQWSTVTRRSTRTSAAA